jgi:hypothetical protein
LAGNISGRLLDYRGDGASVRRDYFPARWLKEADEI